MQQWKFFLRDPLLEMAYTEVEEPEGWDAFEQTLQRSDAFTGMDNLYSDGLIFTEQGSDYLVDKFDLYRFDGHIEIKVELYCDAIINYTLNGIINMVTYRNEQGRVSVSFEDTSFQRKLLNRLTTPIKLSDDLSIEGVNIGGLSRLSIPFHSKEIKYTGSYKVNPVLLPIHIVDGDNGHTTPWTVVGADLIGATEPQTLDIDSGEFNIITNSGTLERSIRIVGHVDVSPLWITTRDDANTYTYTGGFLYRVTDSDGIHNVYSAPAIAQGTANQYIIDFDITIRLAPGDSCHIYILDSHEETLPGSGTLARDDYADYGSTSSLNMDEFSIFPSSSVDNYKIYEVLNQVVSSITDRADSIRSDFFGRVDSVPYSYDETGCGAEMAYTNGLNIRNMLDNLGNSFEIYANFQQLFNALNVIHGIGMRVEKIGGVPYLRIEPKEYFYNNSPIMTFSNVSDLAISVAVDYAWNEIEIGFTKWQAEDINGIDEFNTKHVYAFPVKNINKRLLLSTDIITGGYAIETTRRQQYNTEPTTDWKYDNDGFFVSLNRTEQTFDTQEENPYHQTGDVYPKTYPIGTITERSEAFIQVDNVISPETSYNLRYSPARCMVNNYRYVCGTISHSPDMPLKFQQGEGNTVMTTEMNEDCDVIDGNITENQDIVRGMLKANNRFPFFEPVKLDFTYPMTRNEFENIKANENKSILVSCTNGNNRQATLKEIKYIDNAQGGIATITALNSPCIDGAFTDAFADAFNTGSC